MVQGEGVEPWETLRIPFGKIRVHRTGNNPIRPHDNLPLGFPDAPGGVASKILAWQIEEKHSLYWEPP